MKILPPLKTQAEADGPLTGLVIQIEHEELTELNKVTSKEQRDNMNIFQKIIFYRKIP